MFKVGDRIVEVIGRDLFSGVITSVEGTVYIYLDNDGGGSFKRRHPDSDVMLESVLQY